MLGCPGKRILDIGCGYGTYSVLFSIFGAREVIGIDALEGSIEGFNMLLSIDTSVKVKAEVGDEYSLGEERFDIIFCSEMLSHVHEVRPFIKEITKHINPDGTLFITDGNNMLNPYSLLYTSLYKGVVCEYKGGVAFADFKPSYLEQRKEIIQKEFPNLDEKKVAKLARKTRGLWGNGISRAVKEYLETGSISLKSSYPFRDPVTGQCEERCLNPYTIKRILIKEGYEVKIKPYFGKFESRYEIGRCIAKLPLSVVLSPVFNIIAKKVKA